MSTLESRLITYKEAADLLRVSTRSVMRLVKNETLPAVRVGDRTFLRQQDVDAYIDKQVDG